MQNATARLITGTRCRDHITPVLCELHWLPIRECVKFKVACLVCQSLSGQAPLYLADDCCVSDSTQRSLLSADIPTCVVPRTLSSYSDRTFAAAWSRLRNSLPVQLAILTSPMDCSDDSWRDTFFGKHEHYGALWLWYAAPSKNTYLPRFTWNTTTTTVLRPFFRDHPGEPVAVENIWTLWCKGRLTEADTQTIRLGDTPSRLTIAHLHHPPFFYIFHLKNDH